MSNPTYFVVCTLLLLGWLVKEAIALSCVAVLNNVTNQYEGGYNYAVNNTLDGTACVCQTNLRWDSTQQMCVVDCPNIPYSTGKVLGNFEC